MIVPCEIEEADRYRLDLDHTPTTAKADVSHAHVVREPHSETSWRHSVFITHFSLFRPSQANRNMRRLEPDHLPHETYGYEHQSAKYRRANQKRSTCSPHIARTEGEKVRRLPILI